MAQREETVFPGSSTEFLTEREYEALIALRTVMES
jgi:hypothetical protein